VFGAEGAEFAGLRKLLPPAIKLGSRLAVLPIPRVDYGRWSPWGRFWAMRREYDAIVERLITKAARDKDLDGRDDILALMLQSRYDDGSGMSHSEIADQLLTLLTAGHETTATTLAWAIERLRRHPAVLCELVEEADAGGSALREATILEVQRTRPVIDLVGRQVKADSFHLGRWTLPKGYTVLVSIDLVHDAESVFPNAEKFDPSRFLGARPDLYQWIPFGGGTRRCLGAAFATTEMKVVLKTVLGEARLRAADPEPEPVARRMVTLVPKHGTMVVLEERLTPPAPRAAEAPAEAAEKVTAA
jgi:cytochrome P450